MIEFTFEVNGQDLRRTDRVNPAGDVVGQLWAVFEFDDWWEDTFPIARFMKSGVIYDVEIINDRCLVPYQALSGEGKFYVTVYAVVPSGRKTTNKEVVEYTTSGLNLSIPPAPQEGTLWEKLYKSLYGGQKGQYLQKHSDGNYDFDFVDLPTEGTENLYMINDLSNLSEFYTCASSIEETGDSVFPYELLVWGGIKLGDWDFQTGEFDSYFNTDFGLKKVEVDGSFIPSLNNGDVDIVIASTGNNYGANTVKNIFDSAFSGGPYDYHNISSDIEFTAFDCSIMFKHKFKFEFDPENGWDDELITSLLKGETNYMGDKLTQIGIRISIPKRKDIEVV